MARASLASDRHQSNPEAAPARAALGYGIRHIVRAGPARPDARLRGVAAIWAVHRAGVGYRGTWLVARHFVPDSRRRSATAHRPLVGGGPGARAGSGSGGHAAAAGDSRPGGHRALGHFALGYPRFPGRCDPRVVPVGGVRCGGSNRILGRTMTAQGLDRVIESGVIAVVRARETAGLTTVARAMAEGGVRALEITLTTPGAVEAIAELSGDGGGVVVGAGTVLDASAARSVLDAGARFVVSPTLELDVIRVCRDRNVPCIPGAFTPTE